MPRVILHVDMDAFFGSIEQRDNPEYLGKPLIIGSMPDQEGTRPAACVPEEVTATPYLP